MTDYLPFTARVEEIVWGKAHYTIIRLPPSVDAAFMGAARLEGEINDHPVNLAPSRAPVVEGRFLWAGKSLLDRIGIVPGEYLEIRLRPADPNAIEMPEGLDTALKMAGLQKVWQALTAGKQRSLIYKINTAKTPATRAKRIAALIAELSA